jgi:mannosyltransferase
MIAMLIVSAHGLTLLTYGRRVVLQFLVTAAGAIALVAPLAWMGLNERHAVAWIQAPTVSDLGNLPDFLAHSPMLLNVWILTGIAVVVVSGLVPASSGARSVLTVALPWAVFPPIALFLLGQLTPLYGDRYLLFCLPGVVLIVAVGLARLPLWAAGLLTVFMILAAAPAHLDQREVRGHGENLRPLLQIMQDEAHSGEAVVFDPGDTRIMAEAYPQIFSRLDDITLGRGPAESGKLAGDRAVPADVAMDMATHQRVWVIGRPDRPEGDPPTQAAMAALTAQFRLARTWQPGVFDVQLYERR